MTKILKLSLGCSCLALAMPAFAQSVDPAPETPQAAPDDALPDTASAADGGEIMVTGSRIRQRNLISVSPIVQAGAEDIAIRGTTRTEDFLNRLPQVQAAQSANTSLRGITGTAQVDLRGLGPARTLVLVNGRRLPYGSPRSTPSDLNMVPTPLIKNVEVLTGGASAVYGSDAIAGVVNFTLMDNFDGFRVNSNWNAYQHNNNNETLQNLARSFAVNYPNQYVVPADSVLDGFGMEHSFLAGTNFGDGRGNITAYATYRENENLQQGQRDYSICKLNPAAGGTAYTCAPSAIGDITTFAVTGVTGLPTTFRASNNQFLARNANIDRFNDQAVAQYLRPDQRITLGANGHFEISDALIPFFEFGYVRTKTNSDYSPSAVQNAGIAAAGGINCDNPFLSAQQQSFLCTGRGLSTGSNYDPVTGAYLGPQSVATGVTLSRRTYENGPRADNITLKSLRFVGGLRGALGDAFNYEVSGSYSKVTLNRVNKGLPSALRSNIALFAVTDRRVGSATFGRPVCAINADATTANDDPTCAPLDYFSTNGPSAAANAYINTNQVTRANTTLVDILGNFSGDLGQFGIASPFATNGIGFAVGFEYRRNAVDQTTTADAIELQEDYNLTGATKVAELYAEINVPLVEDRPFMKLLSFEAAYRFSKYYDQYNTDTYKLGASWAPVRDLRFRGSYQRAVRVPTVLELFAGQSRQLNQQLPINTNGLFDPCAGTNPSATFAQCARTGVTAVQYGTIADNNFFGVLSGGNPDLKAETSDTYSLGVVLEPSFVPGFSLSVDAFDIRVGNLVGTVNPVLALSNCLQSGDPYFCGLIKRGTGGTLWSDRNAYFVRTNINTGSLRTRGLDINARYALDLDQLLGARLGNLSLAFTGTYLDSYKVKPLPNSTEAQSYECSGVYGSPCGAPRPKWRHSFVADWKTPWDVDMTVTWRRISRTQLAQSTGQTALAGGFSAIDKYLDGRNYIDLALALHPVENLTFRLGVNNLFDVDPPLTSVVSTIDGGMGNTYPAFYDTLGRYVFFGFTANF